MEPVIIESWRAGLLGKDNWGSNIAAGVVVGVVAIPLAMGFAIAAGAKPEQEWLPAGKGRYPSWNPASMWLPSQNGLFADFPHRQSVTRLRIS